MSEHYIVTLDDMDQPSAFFGPVPANLGRVILDHIADDICEFFDDSEDVDVVDDTDGRSVNPLGMIFTCRMDEDAAECLVKVLMTITTHCDLFLAHATRAQQYYDVPGRHYHTYYHALAVATQATEWARQIGIDEVRITEMALAALWHDAIYIVGSDTCVIESASKFIEVNEPSTDWPVGLDRGRIYQMILDTQHSAPPHSYEGALLCDADFAAALVGSATEYAHKVECIKQEVLDAGYSDADWFYGRIRFLEGLVNRRRWWWTSSPTADMSMVSVMRTREEYAALTNL